MMKRSLLTAGLFTASLFNNVFALPYGFYDARSVGMGNVSVATGGITTAALSNPGMLRVNENNDDYALLLPALGVQVIDDGNVIDLVDEFQAIGTPANVTEAQRQIAILEELEDASLIAAVIPNAAFVVSGDSFTWGISLRGNGVVSAGLDDLTGINPPTLNPDANVVALGVSTIEVGLPMGTDFSFAGMQLSVGITPKYVQVDAVEYLESITTATVEDIQDATSEDLGSFTTVDAGLVLSLIDTFRVGIVAKNLIEETKYTSGVNNGGRPTAVNFEAQYRVGASFDGGFFTLAADMDLNERKPIGFENPSQSFSVGAEFDAFSIAQLRVGSGFIIAWRRFLVRI